MARNGKRKLVLQRIHLCGGTLIRVPSVLHARVKETIVRDVRAESVDIAASRALEVLRCEDAPDLCRRERPDGRPRDTNRLQRL